jgi:hypothetical protein
LAVVKAASASASVAFRLIDGAHAARLGAEHLLRTLDGDLRGVHLGLRLQDAAIGGGLQIGEAQHFIERAAEHRRDGVCPPPAA